MLCLVLKLIENWKRYICCQEKRFSIICIRCACAHSQIDPIRSSATYGDFLEFELSGLVWNLLCKILYMKWFKQHNIELAYMCCANLFNNLSYTLSVMTGCFSTWKPLVLNCLVCTNWDLFEIAQSAIICYMVILEISWVHCHHHACTAFRHM